QDVRDLGGVLRQRDRERALPVCGERIGLVGREPQRLVDDALATEDRAQRADDIFAAREEVRIGFGEADHGRRPFNTIGPPVASEAACGAALSASSASANTSSGTSIRVSDAPSWRTIAGAISMRVSSTPCAINESAIARAR